MTIMDFYSYDPFKHCALPWSLSLYIGKLSLKLTTNYDFSVFSMEDWFKFVQTEIMVDWLLVIGLIGLDGFSSY